MTLTPEERVRIAHALDMWMNYIQTGNVVLSAQDAAKRGEKAKAISVEQMKTIVEMAELRDRVLAG